VRLRTEWWDWSFAEDGALALDRHELWDDLPAAPPIRLSQAPGLKARQRFASVPAMPPRAGQAFRVRRERRTVHRVRRFAGFGLLACVLVATALLTAFGSGSSTVVRNVLAPSKRLLPTGPPTPQIVASQGAVRIQLPIAKSRVTAIGYHAVEGGLPLEPLGRQGNEGLLSRLARRLFGGGGGDLVWYQLPGGKGSPTGALDVGAAPGTDVFSPVDGTVVGLTDYIVNNRTLGVRVDIRPVSAPSVLVSLTRLRPDPALSVGSSVLAATSRLGTVLDFSGVERQALARYTRDAGNHVSLQVRPAAALSIP
jgi:hypothetical protein